MENIPQLSRLPHERTMSLELFRTYLKTLAYRESYNELVCLFPHAGAGVMAEMKMNSHLSMVKADTVEIARYLLRQVQT